MVENESISQANDFTEAASGYLTPIAAGQKGSVMEQMDRVNFEFPILMPPIAVLRDAARLLVLRRRGREGASKGFVDFFARFFILLFAIVLRRPT